MSSYGWGKVGDFTGLAVVVLLGIGALVGIFGSSWGPLWTGVAAGSITLLTAIFMSKRTVKTTGFRYPIMLGAGSAAALASLLHPLLGVIVAMVLTVVLSVVFFYGQAVFLALWEGISKGRD
ncbi:MAG: hypothetical protein K2W82_14275 [Candidatus Obscuribacterales bacterium]|nr:hypothetical protein [Candidatus Obscuribacterales bacterium]